jgi:hypothetical protein
MTLGNMRENGVHSLMVYCSACPRILLNHGTVIHLGNCTPVQP